MLVPYVWTLRPGSGRSAMARAERRDRPSRVAALQRRHAGPVRLVPLLRVAARAAQSTPARPGPPTRARPGRSLPSFRHVLPCPRSIEKAAIVAARRLTRLRGPRYAFARDPFVRPTRRAAAARRPRLGRSRAVPVRGCSGGGRTTAARPAPGVRDAHDACACPCMTSAAGSSPTARSSRRASLPLASRRRRSPATSPTPTWPCPRLAPRARRSAPPPPRRPSSGSDRARQSVVHRAHAARAERPSHPIEADRP